MEDYRFVSFLSPMIEKYREYCIKTEAYCDGNFERIHYFDVYCKENGNSQLLLQKMVNDWFRKRKSEINNSCRSRAFPVIGFIRFANHRKMMDIDIPEIPDGLPCSYVPHIFTDDELASFFRECDRVILNFNNRANINRKMTIPVIFRFLYSTGMRTFEVRQLKRSDIDLSAGIVNIKWSKHNIQHYVVLHDTTLEMIRHYDNQIDSIYPEREYFFPGTGRYPHLTKDWIDINFKSIWTKVSDERAKPYDLRHNYAITNVNSWEGDVVDQFHKLVYLSKTMGHVTLNSTRYYYSYSPHMARLISEYTESGMKDILPEVKHEDFIF